MSRRPRARRSQSSSGGSPRESCGPRSRPAIPWLTRRRPCARCSIARSWARSSSCLRRKIRASDQERTKTMSVRQLLDLKGKVALVTGGSRGLGLQLADALAEMGANLALTARKGDELAEAKAHLARSGVEVVTIVNDLAKTETVAGMVDEV